MPDDSALLAQVREALDSECGHSHGFEVDALPRKLRDCPTCLPERIGAAIEAAASDYDLDEWCESAKRGALAALRGER